MNMLKTTLLMAALTGILIAIGGAIGGQHRRCGYVCYLFRIEFLYLLE